MNQRLERLNNLVLRSIAEASDGAVDQRQDHDRTKVCDILEELQLSTMEVVDVKRIGRLRPDMAPRLIKLSSKIFKDKQGILKRVHSCDILLVSRMFI